MDRVEMQLERGFLLTIEVFSPAFSIPIFMYEPTLKNNPGNLKKEVTRWRCWWSQDIINVSDFGNREPRL